MIQTLVLICHLLLALAIIGLVLLQRGKGAEAGTGFGAGASGTVFGARGSASFFSRATAVLATLFFATSLMLAFFATQTTTTETLIGSTPAENADDAAEVEVDDVPGLNEVDAGGSAPAPATEAASEAATDAAVEESADQ